MSECYFDHPQVKDSDGPVIPYSLFVDGVPYSNTDSIIGFWLVTEITGSRSLLVTLRKSCCALAGAAGGILCGPCFVR